MKNKMKKIQTVMIITLLGMTAFAGCLKEPEENTKLRILTYDVYALSDEAVAQWEAETGYEVEFIKVEDTGSVLDRALQTKENPIADLIIGIDNSYLQIALDNNLFDDYFEDDIASVAGDGFQLDSEALGPYNGRDAIPYDWGRVCINYDSSYADGNNVSVPENLWDFTNSDWAGKVAVENPRTSSPGRSFLIATVDYFANDEDSETDYSDWWSAMKDNDAIITTGWSEAYVTHYSGGYGVWEDGHIGDAHAVVSYCHSPGAEAYWGGGETTSVAVDFPRASFLQVEYAGITTGSKNIPAARSFIDHLLSSTVQVTIPDTNVMYPALSEHSLPAGAYTNHTAVPEQDAEITPSEIATSMEEWLTVWDNAVA